jgi:type IV pilus assembly protein PilC
MGANPDVFDPISRRLIAAGESGGGFDAMLDRLAVLTRKQLQIRSPSPGQWSIPALLIVIAIAVLNLMLLFVLPRFTGLFATLDVPLPPSTQLLMGLQRAAAGLLVGRRWEAAVAGSSRSSMGGQRRRAADARHGGAEAADVRQGVKVFAIARIRACWACW